MDDANIRAWDEFFGGYSFRLSWRHDGFRPDDASDPELDFISQLTGEILFCPDASEPDTERIVGEMAADVVHFGEATNKGRELVDVVGERPELLAAYGAVCPGEADVRADIEEDGTPEFLVHVARLRIEPAHRRRGLGLCLLHKLMHVLTDSVLVVRPFPLQFGEPSGYAAPDEWRWGLGGFQGTRAQGVAKLERYYGSLGFRKIDDTWMVVSTRVRVPRLYDVLEPYRLRVASLAAGTTKEV